ncbi:MAG TPA: class I SAM-dependent methyltransferase [Planctomycetota bacterium]|jgi:acetylserotonin N-methyltransferase|nr:class I SAM-dependent methyltransferase [Planctomycetota bacterium]
MSQPIDPTPVLTALDGFRRSKTMFAALELGVFERLGRGPARAEDLSHELGLHADATERLLDACVGLGLLEKKDGAYSNHTSASTYLVRSSPQALVGYLDYSNRVGYKLWGDLETAIRKGTHLWETTYGLKGNIFDHFFKTEDSKRDFLLGMHGMGMLSSPLVVRAFDLGRFKHLVDLGGATGHLALEACRRYPKLKATVFDLPPVVASAREFLATVPDGSRVELVAGDFFADPLPEADLFALGRILHDWSPEKVRTLLRKICDRLSSGGALLIAERLLNADKTGPLSGQLQSLNMLVCTEGKERNAAEYRTLLLEAGFSDVQARETGSVVDAVLAVK